ncbi:Deoxycytidylate deaminase [Yarrowia sp. C11]|nr:Deoxycytidylate deaminase [Yarrowia sp. E02]KAG5365131.1 Deoxycytidylate deaminase [Yarrowia sp. C11]
MFIGISGLPYAGIDDVADYLVEELQFKRVFLRNGDPDHELHFSSVDDLVAYVTPRWQTHYVLAGIDSAAELKALEVRPFFLHLTVDAPMLESFERAKKTTPDLSLEAFIEDMEQRKYSKELTMVANSAKVHLVNKNGANSTELRAHLREMDLMETSRVRPSWDAYFMRLADLAAQRSNCMKRQVGCVIVRDSRVICTGYNGTPRGAVNCNEGGCSRCNSGEAGAALSTCLCLHAEENALLEAGRERIRDTSKLYCNTCPCLTCSIKIVQAGIKEVIYSKSYNMDAQSSKVLHDAGVTLRQFTAPVEYYSN